MRNHAEKFSGVYQTNKATSTTSHAFSPHPSPFVLSLSKDGHPELASVRPEPVEGLTPDYLLNLCVSSSKLTGSISAVTPPIISIALLRLSISAILP